MQATFGTCWTFRFPFLVFIYLFIHLFQTINCRESTFKSFSCEFLIGKQELIVRALRANISLWTVAYVRVAVVFAATIHLKLTGASFLLPNRYMIALYKLVHTKLDF